MTVPTRPDVYRGLPQVMTNEDGEIAWAPGHVAAHRFVRAAIRHARVDGWADDIVSTLRERGIQGAVLSVQYCWMKQNPNNEERMDWCDLTDPCAEPFTYIVLTW